MNIERNHRILIIDDHRAIHDDFRKILDARDAAGGELDEARGNFFGIAVPARTRAVFEIDSAFQGGEGVSLLRTSIGEGRPYALAFVDVRMPPGIDGLETVAQLWELYPDLQVVLCTAFSDYSWQETVNRLGHSNNLVILRKPFDAIEVLQLAHALTEKWAIGQALALQIVELEINVAERIRELMTANRHLCEQAALLDKAQDAIVVHDVHDVITFWNASAERLYGWSAAEALGRKVPGLLYSDDTEYQKARTVLLEKGAWIGELTQQTKDGKGIVVEGHWTLVRDEAGQPRALLSIDTDVTEKKKLEAQFLRAQRMESIGILAGGIAHDLNNVLGPVMMVLEILQSRFPDAETGRILQMLETSVERGAGMIKQVLQFARGAAGERILVQPGHLIRDLRRVADDTFPKTIQVRTAVASDVWLVSADPTQLHQVLLNLCVNARDAMPDGGTLTIAAENVALDAAYASMILNGRPGDFVCLQVSDTGTGMPPEVMARIFEPFFTTKEQGKGTGLGLSTTLGIVKSHGGFIRVESEPGKGTTFKIHLPAVLEGEAAAASENAPNLLRGNGEMVLIIDDEESHRVIMGDTLKEFGYRVLLAGDGAEACSLYAQRPAEIDVVLTDLMMPIMDGAATIRTLKRMNQQLPIIADSGNTVPQYVALARAAGADTFLARPYRTETLLTALRDSLAARGESHAGHPQIFNANEPGA